MSKDIETHLQEERSFAPSGEFSAKAHIGNLAAYEEMYAQSIEDPESFWAEQANKNLSWSKPFESVLEYDFKSIGSKEGKYVNWFGGGQLNVSYNCVDRHVEAGKGDKVAIIWQGEDAKQERKITYSQLQEEVSSFAAALAKIGVTKGSVVTIYLPMIPELPISMLACARLGAIHSVVFSAFSSGALRARIDDCQSTHVITSDVGYHAGKTVELKKKADEAVDGCKTISNVLVVNRGNTEVSMSEPRDVWLHELKESLDSSAHAPVAMDSEDPLFILYTSGSTGKPKGVLHTSAGYLLYATLTSKYVFDLHDDDVFWCTADCGWITGHSYLTYGPLANGATCVMFEGVPTYPEPNRFWQIVEKHKVSIFYTAPTAIRALMRLGTSWPNSCDLSSLRLLGTVGEPINPEAWIWYHEHIGKSSCPIVDTWWQTETGGVMLTTLPGAMPSKPGAAGKPFFGISPEIFDKEGKPVTPGDGGSLVINSPWPGMIRGVYGDAKNELIYKVYFSHFDSVYVSGDGCRQDADGYYWLLGRIDDVINVSAHRFATAEIESALVAHKSVAEAAVVGCPHETKGQAIYCFVTLVAGIEANDSLEKELVLQVRNEIGPIATPEAIQFAPGLPKTRSGKIMRRILRKIAEGRTNDLGDISTLADPTVVESLVAGAKSVG